MKTDDLEDVYSAKTPAQSQAIYDKWSSGYDVDCLSNGFRLPSLGAGLLARHMGLNDGPILDGACGTGLVGETLNIMGYGPITGCDLSPEMMALAAHTGAYADFQQADMGANLPFDDDHFAGFIAVGCFGPGHAPPSSLTHLARVTRPGGYGVFNLIEATYVEQGFPPVIDALTGAGADAGKWQVISTSQPFLPFLLSEPDLWSRLYVVRMT